MAGVVVESTKTIGTATTSTESDEDEDCISTARSSAKRPAKKAKKDVSEEEDLISTLGRVGFELAAAIVTAAKKSAPQPPPVDEIPDNLYETLLGMEGYSETQIDDYYIFLVSNPRSAKAFMKMGHVGQLVWMDRYINKEFKD